MPVPGIVAPEPYPAEAVAAQAIPCSSTTETCTVDAEAWATGSQPRPTISSSSRPAASRSSATIEHLQPVLEHRPLDGDEAGHVLGPAGPVRRAGQQRQHRGQDRAADDRRGVGGERPVGQPDADRTAGRPACTPRGRSPSPGRRARPGPRPGSGPGCRSYIVAAPSAATTSSASARSAERISSPAAIGSPLGWRRPAADSASQPKTTVAHQVEVARRRRPQREARAGDLDRRRHDLRPRRRAVPLVGQAEAGQRARASRPTPGRPTAATPRRTPSRPRSCRCRTARGGARGRASRRCRRP